MMWYYNYMSASNMHDNWLLVSADVQVACDVIKVGGELVDVETQHQDKRCQTVLQPRWLTPGNS